MSAFVGLAQKCCQQFGWGNGSAVYLAEAVQQENNGQTALVQDGCETFDDKQQVLFHQANGNRFADNVKETQARGLGNGFLPAALLLFGLDRCVGSWFRLPSVMHGAFWIGTDTPQFALSAAFGNDNLCGELAGLVLRPITLRTFCQEIDQEALADWFSSYLQRTEP